jgi:5'-3' exonuclease, N-terminal resolvase-like domain
MTEHSLIIDASNLLYRSFYASNPRAEDSISLVHHKNLMMLNKYFKSIQPDRLVVVFDRPNSWRKVYTEHTPDRPSPLLYKGHRRLDSTEREKIVYAKFLASIAEFEQLLRDQTKVNALACDGLEADDLIAGYTQAYPEHRHTIISGDKDFIQLLRNPNVSLIDPADGKPRSLAEWEYDPDYFIFHKCCKGDKGDNVLRIFPKVFEAKVKKYYTDELARVNAFNAEWVFDGHKIVPGQLFVENKLLMDLTAQPEGIKELITDTIASEVSREKHYKHNTFLRFCGKHELRNIINDAEQFIKMFTTHP